MDFVHNILTVFLLSLNLCWNTKLQTPNGNTYLYCSFSTSAQLFLLPHLSEWKQACPKFFTEGCIPVHVCLILVFINHTHTHTHTHTLHWYFWHFICTTDSLLLFIFANYTHSSAISSALTSLNIIDLSITNGVWRRETHWMSPTKSSDTAPCDWNIVLLVGKYY